METCRFEPIPGGPIARASEFAVDGGAKEVQLCIMPSGSGDFVRQLGQLEDAYRHALEALGLTGTTAILRRFFLSDSANQQARLARSTLARTSRHDPVAISIVEQAPLPEGRVALWAYHVVDQGKAPVKEQVDTGVLVKRGANTHLWTTDLVFADTVEGRDPRAQTRAAFDAYMGELRRHGASLRDHVIRTWIYVHGVDRNYGAMSEERREIFLEEGMTSETHYIASTGIAGRRADSRRVVLLEGYAMPGIQPGQIRFLVAPEHLSPTSAYGVTFERGVSVDHGDRRHLFISGTASIDKTGKVRHLQDIAGQTERTYLNIQKLLEHGGATLADVAQMIVYLRDPGDRAAVASYLEEQFPELPFVLVLAPVCRPEWLIEVECWAVVGGGDAKWGRF